MKTKRMVSLVLFGILITMQSFTGCDMSETSSQEQGKVSLDTKASQTLARYKIYDRLGHTGNSLELRMVKKSNGSKRIERTNGTSFYCKNLYSENWAGKIKSVQILDGSGAAEIFVFRDVNYRGGRNRVIKYNGSGGNIPNGFGICSILFVPAPEHKIIKDVYIYCYKNGQKKYWNKNSNDDNAIQPNSSNPVAFTISYLDVDGEFFNLTTPWGQVVCSDLHKGRGGPLHANRFSTDYWELFRVRGLYIKAISSGLSLKSYGDNYPISGYTNARYITNKMYIQEK